VPSDFRVEVRTEDGATIIVVSGELDLATSPELERQFEVAASDAVRGPLVLDLRRLEFMDSTGLSLLVKAREQAEEAGRPFGVIKGSPQVERLLSLTGVGERIAVADTLSELLAQI
jgi:anti-anti-sigma factor